MESKLNWQQQHLLSNCIEIVGLSDVNDKNVMTKAKQLFHKALSIDVPDNKIEKCYIKKVRAKTNSNVDSSTSKPIICVSFSDLHTKQGIMNAKKTNKNNLNTRVNGIDGVGGSGSNNSSRSTKSSSKGSGIYINDSLTKYTQALFMKAKDTIKLKGVKYVWFKDNKILVRKVEGGKVISIRSFCDLALI